MVLLYRSPDAIVQSHHNQRGMHAVPGLLPPYLFTLAPTDLPHLNADAYTTLVLTHYYRRFLAIARQDERTLLLAYQPDGSALLKSMLDFLGLTLTESDWVEIDERSGFHAKRPGQVFAEAMPNGPTPTFMRPAQSAFADLETERLNRLTK